jgi:hypothetical protein
MFTARRGQSIAQATAIERLRGAAVMVICGRRKTREAFK